MTPRYLRLTINLWESTLAALTRYSERRVEGGCLWYGIQHDDTANALVVGVPKQLNYPQYFEIPPQALAELNNLVRQDLVVVAQVHLHPGISTTHSPWDDRMMVSRRLFSLVIPRYAHPPCSIASAGIHAHNGTGWVKVPSAEVQRRLVVVENVPAEGKPLMVDAR